VRTLVRRILDKLFTASSGLAVLLMAAALVLILGPIIWRGSDAVFFDATVEFRRMQLGELHRGDAEAVADELDRAHAARQKVYDLLDRFSEGIDTSGPAQRAKEVLRQYEAQLANRVEAGAIGESDSRRMRRRAKKLRNALLDAYEADEADAALARLADVLESPEREALADTAAGEFFRMAARYKEVAARLDMSLREKYADPLASVRETIGLLLGPRPGQPVPDLSQFRYGATRWDQATALLDELLWAEQWVSDGAGRPMRKVRTRREEVFAGTELAGLFPLIERDLEEMMLPQSTVYWQYFIDDSPPGHFFGGVGPEAVGTLLLTALSMLLAVPTGVTTAAYLVECTRGGPLVRVLRTCINTLAGVPSIVFGLFGLACFVLWMLPGLGLSNGSSILAGAMTLGVLVLPIVIRASEEAIRAVPASYREASLALGAGALRTFVTVTFPAALPGILTGVILSMSRAAGETAPILFTAAVAVGKLNWNITQPTRTLSYGSYDLAVGDRLAAKVPHNQFGMILALILLVLLLNTAAIVIRWRIGKRLRGA